jgi:hypothetical protein
MATKRTDEILGLLTFCWMDGSQLPLDYRYSGYDSMFEWVGFRTNEGLLTIKENRIGVLTDEGVQPFYDVWRRLLRETGEKSYSMEMEEKRQALKELMTPKKTYREATDLENFFDDVMRELPHGSGIDYDWSVVKHRGNVVWFGNGYHYMNDVGMYDGNFSFTVSYSYDLAARTVKFRRLWTDETEWLVKSECGECDGKHKWNCKACSGYGIQFEDGARWTCEDCDGEGDIICPECDEEGLTEYDELPELISYLEQCFWEPINVNE